jgi:hypothetical protein
MSQDYDGNELGMREKQEKMMIKREIEKREVYLKEINGVKK